MERVAQTPRRDWAQRLEACGFDFHSIDADGVVRHDGSFNYWREDVAYRFSEAEVETLYEASKELHRLALETVDAVVRERRFEPFALPPKAAELIALSWQRRDFSLYGRFDLAWDGRGAPRLLEYNADTPTSLLESSVAQWFWKEDVAPGADQFNSIHEALVERWKALRRDRPMLARLAVTADLESAEDAGTARYVLDTAHEAGFDATLLDVLALGADDAGHFYDASDRSVDAVFKLYPWEWAMREAFAPQLAQAKVAWIEPSWKMLLSNKALLALLWERYPGHPNLLPAYLTPEPLAHEAHVKKPLLSREGANVTLVVPGDPAAGIVSEGPYGGEGFVWQAAWPLPVFDGMHAMLGTWIVGDEPVGLGVREDVTPVTRNTSFFVPHYFT